MSRTKKAILGVAVATTALLSLAAVPSPVHGLIQSSCAPWDGPAIAITLASEALHCERAPSGPHLSMGIWRGLPLHGGQVIKFGDGADNGYGSRCTHENNCQAAESGAIEFQKYDEKSGAQGRYELHFKNGETINGTFEVQWCNTRTVCR